jgi:tetratricopeptide (TPR) repeat protein
LKTRSRYTYFSLSFGLALMVGCGAMAQRSVTKKNADAAVSQNALRASEFDFIEAQKYFILEDYAKALLYFQRALEFNPENATIHYKIAEVLAKSNKPDDLAKASASIEKALKLENKNKYFYSLASSIYAGLNDFGKAEKALETMMEEVKGQEEFLYKLAALYVFDKKPMEAIKIYEKAEQFLGVSELSSLQKQRLYLEQGKVDEAIKEGEKLIETYPEEERYVLAFAETLSNYKQASRAISFMEQYLTANPGSGNAKVVLAVLFRESGQEKKSRDLLTAIFDDPTVEPTGKLALVGPYCEQVIQNRSKKIDDRELENFALSVIKKLTNTYPKESAIHTMAGDLYLAVKMEREAQLEFIKATKSGSTFDAWQNLMYLDSQLNQFDSLIVHTENALEYFPNQAMVYYFNGYGQFRKNRFKEAASSLEQAKKLSAENPNFQAEISGMLGDAYNGLKEYQKSDKAYEEALVVDPNNSLILNNYSYYLALRKENLDKAEKMSALLIKNNPTNASFLDTYAWVLFMKGNYKEAKKVMEKAIAGGDATATHFEHFGDILFQLNDIDAAIEQWHKARSLSIHHELLDKKIENKKLY